MEHRIAHHLVYTCLIATKPVACKATFELARAGAREYANGHAALFISGARAIWPGEEGVGEPRYVNFKCPICSRSARVLYKVDGAPQLPPGEYQATITGVREINGDIIVATELVRGS